MVIFSNQNRVKPSTFGLTFKSKDMTKIFKSVKLALIVCIHLGFTTISFAQNKSSIAVANPNVVGLKSGPTIAAKLVRLELIKQETYMVYDEFDMEDIYKVDSSYRYNCLSKSCLIRMGKELDVDYIISGSFDQLGNKIVISLKIIDVRNETIFRSKVREFDDQEDELQRMTEIVLKDLHDIEIPKTLDDRLKFNNEVITSNNVGRIKNNGPRVGCGVMLGDLSEFATRPEDQGGLDIFPVVSMIGFQLEAQYVGTENFSALVEGIVNVSGLEQGKFIPTLSLMNGFRFGQSGWEFAFGPGLGIKYESKGFFDSEGLFGDAGNYVSENDWAEYGERNFQNATEHPEYYSTGYFVAPSPSEFNEDYNFDKKHADTRGKAGISTSFVFAFGRTFKAGAMNIPVNVFYSSKKGGGLLGVNVGFNVMRSKKSINKRRRR